MVRKWYYLGHVVRQPENHVTMAGLRATILASCHHVRLGPWNSSYTWLQRMRSVVCYLCDGKPGRSLMRSFAADRALWSSKCARVREHYSMLFPCQHPNAWATWQSSLRTAAPWMKVAYFSPGYIVGEFCLLWLDEHDGWQHFYGSLLTVLRWRNVLCGRGQRIYNVLRDDDVLDFILGLIPHICTEMMQHDVLLSFPAVPAKWVTRVARAVGVFEEENGCGSRTSVEVVGASRHTRKLRAGSKKVLKPSCTAYSHSRSSHLVQRLQVKDQDGNNSVCVFFTRGD